MKEFTKGSEEVYRSSDVLDRERMETVESRRLRRWTLVMNVEGGRLTRYGSGEGSHRNKCDERNGVVGRGVDEQSGFEDDQTQIL